MSALLPGFAWLAGAVVFVIEAFELAWRNGATRHEPHPLKFPGIELASVYAVGVAAGFALLAELAASPILLAVPGLLGAVAYLHRRSR